MADTRLINKLSDTNVHGALSNEIWAVTAGVLRPYLFCKLGLPLHITGQQYVLADITITHTQVLPTCTGVLNNICLKLEMFD